MLGAACDELTCRASGPHVHVRRHAWQTEVLEGTKSGGGGRVAPVSDELAALLRRASLVVANDTGPLHLSAALGTATLGLFGPTPAARNRPYGPRCRGIQSPDGTMERLDPAAVFAAARAMIEAGGAGS